MSRLTRQPGQGTLDLGHPLARGLIFAAYHTQQEAAGAPRNAVTGAMGSTVYGTPTLYVTPNGAARYWSSAGSKVAAPLNGLTKLSLAFDLYWPSYTNSDCVCFSSESWTSGGTMLIDPDGGAGLWAFEYRHTNGQRCIAMFTRPSAGLHSYVLEFDVSLTSSQACAAYVDGVAQSLSYYTNSIGASGTFRDLNLTFMHHDGPSLQGTGSVCNVKIYNRLLTGAEARALARNPWAMFNAASPRAAAVRVVPATEVALPVRRTALTRQPGQGTIDRGHPLARGLIFAAYHTQQEIASPPRNAITETMGSHVFGTTTVATDAKGVARAWAGSAGSKVAVPLGGLTKVTLAFDLYWPSYANNDDVCFSSESWSTGGTWLIDPNGGTGLWAFEYRHTNGQRCIGMFTRPSAGWHSYVLEFDTSLTTSQACAAFVDGKPQSLTYYNNSIGASGTFRDLNLTFMHHDGPSLQGTGRLRNVKIYNRLLGASEAVALAANPWQMFRLGSPRAAADVYVGYGPYQIGGTITAATIPLEGAIVRLYNENTGELLRTTTTDASGAYGFGTAGDELDPSLKHTVVAYDAITGYQYNGGILRGLTAGRTVGA